MIVLLSRMLAGADHKLGCGIADACTRTFGSPHQQ
jgi:hypothetical protein